MRRAALLAMFVVSGASALCYEVAWTRHLSLVFGNTTRAVALLLAAYMLGLALGAEVGGRLADRTRRPAAWYAAFELAIAGFALVFGPLVGLVSGAAAQAGGPLLFAAAFLILVIPTFCMGTTLPLLARAVVADPAQTGREVGTLYAANVVGAMAGTLLTGFVLIERAGVLGATHWAAAANAAVGVAGLALFGRAAPAAAAERPPAQPLSRTARAALVAAFASGFIGLAAQVAWTRMLVFFLQGFTWTFSAILGTFLAGLALGGYVFGRAAARAADPAAFTARLMLGVGVAAAGVVLALAHHHAAVRALADVASGLSGDPRTQHRWTLLLASGVVVFVPAFLMGGVLPAAAAMYQRGIGDLGARLGRLYAVNTLGCVAGSLVAGFLLQPTLGPSRSAAVVALAVPVAAAAVYVTGAAKRRRAEGALLAGAAAVSVALVVGAAPGTPFLLRSHVFAGAKGRENALLDEAHGEVCTVSVVRNERESYTLLYTDEFEAAGTKPEYRYMRMLAHLPVALARDPSRTLVICFGTGTTAGSVSLHSAVRELDIVEISPEVLAAAHRFAKENHGVLERRPGLDVRVHVDDGRHFVRASRGTWGVITLEPLMPYTPAAMHFYTEDFYRDCVPRLAPGGVVCQWIPLQGMSGDNFRRLVASFVRVFPESAMFFVDGAVALLGGADGVPLEFARVASRLSDAAVRADLGSIGFDDPGRALATFVTAGEKLRAFGAVPPFTDERPDLEFHPLPSGFVVPWLAQNLVHMKDLRSAWESIPVSLDGAADADRVRETLFLALRSGNHVLEGMIHAETSTLLGLRGDAQGSVDALRDARSAFSVAASLDPGNGTAEAQRQGRERQWWMTVASNEANRGDLAAAEKAAARALEFRALRQDDSGWTLLASIRNRAGKHDAALAAACRAVELWPRGTEARAERAYARWKLGDVPGARADFRLALSAVPLASLPEHVRDAAADVAGPAVGKDERAETWSAADVESALAGTGRGQVSPSLLLACFRGDDPGRFETEFPVKSVPPGDADGQQAVARLAAGWPGAARDLLLGAARDGATSAAVRQAAADAVARRDAAALAAEFRAAVRRSDIPVAVCLARAAAHTSDRRVVEPLLAAMASADAGLRTAAHRSLFAVVGDRAPGLDRLDPQRKDAAYDRALSVIESWWVRARDDVEK